MRLSTEAFEATEFVLKPVTLPDGRVKVTSPSAPGKEWFATDLTTGIRSATKGLQTLQESRELRGNDPAWMTDGTLKGRKID